MKVNYCLPIIKSKIDGVLKMISQNQDYDCFEIWLDHIRDLNLDFVKKYEGKLILRSRRKNLKKIIDSKVSSSCFFDLDISQKKHFKASRLILSYHNYRETPSDEKLQEIVKKMLQQRAAIYKISTFCKSDNDALRLLDLLADLKEQGLKCIVLGMGPKGKVTRIAGCVLGNEITYAPVRGSQASAPGQLTKPKLENILKNIKVCYFVADPVKHSLSPQMHYAGYKALGIENEFIFLRRRIKPEDLKKFVEEIKKDPHFKGASISAPHKIAIMKYLDEIDNVAKKIGAVNTIVKRGKKLTGYNTDWLGAITALEEKINVKNKTVALIGAGGAARAIVYGLAKKGARVKIFNRSLEHAKKLSADFGCEYDSLDNLRKIQKMDIIINTTSVGMNKDKSLIDKKYINQKQLVFDTVYTPSETKLIKDAKQKKAQVILGINMLLYQGIAQFELLTGRKAPFEAMRKALI
ncbi:shikimate dehydrogenase [Candidatus Daviesbacteria bacterium]|nr:shikimate dehydrogenase [Candidatus Daviesbacteria bacterium]